MRSEENDSALHLLVRKWAWLHSKEIGNKMSSGRACAVRETTWNWEGSGRGPDRRVGAEERRIGKECTLAVAISVSQLKGERKRERKETRWPLRELTRLVY